MGNLANISRDLKALARLSPRPVRPEEAAAALGVEVGPIVDEGELLVASGHLEFRDGGFAPGPQADDSEASAVRDGQLAASLAEAIAARGGSAADIGRLYAAAGRWQEARDSLAAAALAPGEDPRTAADLASLALDAQGRAPGLDRPSQGKLHLMRARHLRSTGRSQEAMEDLEVAVRWLEGLERVDALRFTTVVADDLQESQKAETYAALGEGEAWAAGVPAEAGSMLTLRGRVLSRIGFPRESDRVIEVGLEILNKHGNESQRFTGRLNRGWVQLDRGEARDAETSFDRLRGEALELEGPVSQADKEVYWARAAFALGHPKEALEAVGRAEAAAGSLGAPVLSFLAAIARAEGALYFERFEDALAAADRVLQFALSDLPVWENRARILRARALTGLGRLDEASAEAGAALAVTPEGVDGLRLRKEIEVVRLLALPKDAPWPKKAVEDLTDELLQARWNLSAVELMIERSKREKDPELALAAAGLAIDLGLPTVAIRAADAASLWSDPGGQAVGFAAQGVTHHLPQDWEADWTSLPHVAAALRVDVTDDQTASETLTAQWAQVVSEAGLAGYEVLSPAQRRAQGLVRRRQVTSWARRITTAAAVVALAGAVSFGVVTLFAPESTTPEAVSTTEGTTTTTTLALEDRRLAAPANRFLGGWIYGVDNGRSSVAPATRGVGTAEGAYWTFPTADQIVASPVTFGQWTFIASSDNTLYALDMTDGSELWNFSAGDALRATPAVAGVTEGGVGGQGGARTIIAFGDASGTVYFRDALVAGTGPFWEVPTSGSIVGAPVMVDSRVIVASSQPNSAEIISMLPLSREIEWTFTGLDGEAMGPVRAAPAYHEGIVYVTTRGSQGRLYLIDAETGEGICDSAPLGNIDYSPVISGGVVYLATAEGQVYPRNLGDCDRGPANRGFVYQFTGGVSATPVIVGDLLLVPNGPSLVAIDLTNNDPEAFEWIFHSGALIQSAPIVAGDTVYFGNNAGTVFALALHPQDPAGEVFWRWQTSNAIVSSMAVLDGVVFVTGTDGVVYAIGGSLERSAVSGGATTTTTPGITTTLDPNATTTTREPVVTTLIPPTGVGGAQ